MQLPFKEGLELITKGFEKVAEERLWLQYCSIYPAMCRGELRHMTFQDYKKRNLGGIPKRQRRERKPTPPTGELVSWAEKVRRADLKLIKGGGGKK